MAAVLRWLPSTGRAHWAAGPPGAPAGVRALAGADLGCALSQPCLPTPARPPTQELNALTRLEDSSMRERDWKTRPGVDPLTPALRALPGPSTQELPRADAPGREPRQVPAGAQGGQVLHERQPRGHLGQPLHHPGARGPCAGARVRCGVGGAGDILSRRGVAQGRAAGQCDRGLQEQCNDALTFGRPSSSWQRPCSSAPPGMETHARNAAGSHLSAACSPGTASCPSPWRAPSLRRCPTSSTPRSAACPPSTSSATTSERRAPRSGWGGWALRPRAAIPAHGRCVRMKTGGGAPRPPALALCAVEAADTDALTPTPMMDADVCFGAFFVARARTGGSRRPSRPRWRSAAAR